MKITITISWPWVMLIIVVGLLVGYYDTSPTLAYVLGVWLTLAALVAGFIRGAHRADLRTEGFNAALDLVPDIVTAALGDAQLADWFWDELETAIKARRETMK